MCVRGAACRGQTVWRYLATSSATLTNPMAMLNRGKLIVHIIHTHLLPSPASSKLLPMGLTLNTPKYELILPKLVVKVSVHIFLVHICE